MADHDDRIVPLLTEIKRELRIVHVLLGIVLVLLVVLLVE